MLELDLGLEAGLWGPHAESGWNLRRAAVLVAIVLDVETEVAGLTPLESPQPVRSLHFEIDLALAARSSPPPHPKLQGPAVS